MVWYHELYASYKNNSNTIKNNAIAYGNSSYILINKDNQLYVDKYYIDGYTIYGEKHIQRTEYAYGFKNEVSMYKYANTNNLTYVPRMISYNDSKVTITLEYLKDYITIRKYFELRKKLSESLSTSDDEFSSRNNYDSIFKGLMKLLNTMEKDKFVHNNLTMDNIMINPENMDLKVVNLKNSYIFVPEYHKDHTIFNFAKNDLLYTIYKVIHPKEKELFMKYFKYRNPDYYSSNNSTKIGGFYRIGILQLFDEQFQNAVFIEDEEIQTFIKNILFFNLYINLISKNIQ
jgi:hypothetical protein